MIIKVSNLIHALLSLKKYYIFYAQNRGLGYLPSLEKSCISSFRYTLGLSCKTMQRILERLYGFSKGELTIDKIFLNMQKYKYISSSERWLMYYEDCDKKGFNPVKSRELLSIIPQFISDTENLIENITRV